jgi:predicted small secreted protein
MDIEKYKAELEAAIYEGSDGRFYIGGNVIDKVLKEVQSQALHIHGVVASACDDYTPKNDEYRTCKNCGLTAIKH